MFFLFLLFLKEFFNCLPQCWGRLAATTRPQVTATPQLSVAVLHTARQRMTSSVLAVIICAIAHMCETTHLYPVWLSSVTQHGQIPV